MSGVLRVAGLLVSGSVIAAGSAVLTIVALMRFERRDRDANAAHVQLMKDRERDAGIRRAHRLAAERGVEL